MTYQRIEQALDLPPEGPLNARAREKLDIDFKTFADPRSMGEHAKDLAAFANVLGGVLVVGADNATDSSILSYPGVRGQSVADVVGIYEQAGVLCSPSLTVDAVPIAVSRAAWIVAVNVDPFIDQLVGAPAGQGTHAWRFPVRRASQTDNVSPESLPMFQHRTARRAQVLLSGIPMNQRGDVFVFFPSVINSLNGAVQTSQHAFTIVDVPVDRNHFVIGDGARQCRVPLSGVQDVWERADGKWAIQLDGFLDLGVTHLPITYRPRF